MRKFEIAVLPLGINNGDFAGAFTKRVKDVITQMVNGSGPVLHLYSGSSMIGDERVDIDHENATVNCRVEDFITTDRRRWGWVILDPPYAIKRANLKLKDYGENDSLSGNVKWRRILKHYFARHVDNILWLDFCAPAVPCFKRQKLWFFLPGGFESVRTLSWLKRETELLV